MKRRKASPSVFDEPHLRPDPLPAPPTAGAPLADEPAHAPSLPTLEHAAVNSVWDEPDAPPAPAQPPQPAPVAPHEECSACGYSLAGLTTEAACPECGLPIDLRLASYATWLRYRAATVTPRESWLLTAAVALVAGPLAIVTAFWGSNETGDPFALLSAIGAAPTVEEIAKAGAALMIVETRPWLFRSRAQITIACLASAAAFAAVENVLYLNVYVPDPEPSLVAWRWTVCVALHVGCTAIASLGLRRMHREVFALGARPRIEAALPFVGVAILVHAVYNALAIVLSLTHVI